MDLSGKLGQCLSDRHDDANAEGLLLVDVALTLVVQQVAKLAHISISDIHVQTYLALLPVIFQLFKDSLLKVRDAVVVLELGLSEV